MSFARSAPSKGNVSSTVIPSLPTLPKLPSRLQSKRSVHSTRHLFTFDVYRLDLPLCRRMSKVYRIETIFQHSQILVAMNSKILSGEHFSSSAKTNTRILFSSNLSTIVKKSEQLLTPVKPTSVSTTVRRTASLHLTKIDLDRRKLIKPTVKTSTSHYHALEKSEKLHESMSDR